MLGEVTKFHNHSSQSVDSLDFIKLRSLLLKTPKLFMAKIWDFLYQKNWYPFMTVAADAVSLNIISLSLLFMV